MESRAGIEYPELDVEPYGPLILRKLGSYDDDEDAGSSDCRRKDSGPRLW